MVQELKRKRFRFSLTLASVSIASVLVYRCHNGIRALMSTVLFPRSTRHSTFRHHFVHLVHICSNFDCSNFGQKYSAHRGDELRVENIHLNSCGFFVYSNHLNRMVKCKCILFRNSIRIIFVLIMIVRK